MEIQDGSSMFYEKWDWDRLLWVDLLTFWPLDLSSARFFDLLIFWFLIVWSFELWTVWPFDLLTIGLWNCLTFWCVHSLTFWPLVFFTFWPFDVLNCWPFDLFDLLTIRPFDRLTFWPFKLSTFLSVDLLICAQNEIYDIGTGIPFRNKTTITRRRKHLFKSKKIPAALPRRDLAFYNIKTCFKERWNIFSKNYTRPWIRRYPFFLDFCPWRATKLGSLQGNPKPTNIY